MGNTPPTAAPAAHATPERSTRVRQASDLRMGQMISLKHCSSVSGVANSPLFTHYAIFLGNDWTEHGINGGPAVVHYSSQGSRTGVRGRVQVSRLSAFLGERSLADVIAWSDPGIYSPREVVDRALSRLGKSKYWALTNNCEHFARWAISNESFSTQANRVARINPVIVRADEKAHRGWSWVVRKARRARDEFRALGS